MKSAIYRHYGPPEVVTIEDLPKPEPKPNEILVRIQNTTVTSGDVRLRAFDFPPVFWLPARFIFGFFGPKKKTLGHEWSGVVEETGAAVKKFKAGDEVIGTTTLLTVGSHAEYLCLPVTWKYGVIDYKPNILNFESAAALPIGGMTALFLLKKANIQSNLKVLVYGASGSVGTFAVQIGTAFGASVTGVCSAANADMVKSMGAETVIDYQSQDYTESESRYDIVFDAVGKSSKSQAKKVLKRGGTFISIKMITSERPEDLAELIAMAEKGAIKPYIDRKFKLADIQQAHSYVDSGRKKGNVVIEI